MDGPGTADGLPALYNQEDMNKNGKTGEMEWDAMVQEDVQDQLNDTEKLIYF